MNIKKCCGDYGGPEYSRYIKNNVSRFTCLCTEPNYLGSALQNYHNVRNELLMYNNGQVRDSSDHKQVNYTRRTLSG